MKRMVTESLQSFKTHLLQTPLLLGWLLIGPLVSLYQDGRLGLTFSLINLALIGIYALLIRLQTSNPPAPEPVKRPVMELCLTLGLLGLILLIQLLDFGVWSIQPWQEWVSTFFRGIGRWIYEADALPAWTKQEFYLALSSTLKQLLPTLALFLALGYRPREMGFAHPHWKLSATLVGITTAFGLATGVLTRAPLSQVITLYGIGILVNALPEELFFRGLLLPRLEKVFANPLNALVVSALCFNALHVPIAIHNGTSPLMAVLGIFSTGYPTGLIWGYLYLRTRSILPGVVWHAANINLGFILMSR